MTTKTLIDEQKIRREEIKYWLIKHYEDLVKNRYYGKLIVTFQDGVLESLKKEEILKPPKGNGK